MKFLLLLALTSAPFFSPGTVQTEPKTPLEATRALITTVHEQGFTATVGRILPNLPKDAAERVEDFCFGLISIRESLVGRSPAELKQVNFSNIRLATKDDETDLKVLLRSGQKRPPLENIIVFRFLYPAWSEPYLKHGILETRWYLSFVFDGKVPKLADAFPKVYK